MRIRVFAQRNLKEMIRDPLTLAFGLGFPLVLMLLFTAIQANVPVELFALENITPGMIVFGFSFISLFAAMLIAKDRSTSFMMRLYASPLRAADFIWGYVLPLIGMAIAQGIVCLVAAFCLGLPVRIEALYSFLAVLPASVLYIGIGLLAGSALNDKQVGGICGALLTNLSAWLSGTWFDLNLVGGAFKTIAYGLPFAHAVDAGKLAMAGDYRAIWPHLIWVGGYSIVIIVLAVVVFRRKMTSGKE